MASYSVARGEVGAHGKTLTASTVDTVTFAENIHTVEIVSDGDDAIYVGVDGVVPTVGGAANYYLPASASTREVKSDNGAATVIKLISAGTPTYSVSRAD